VANTPFYLQSIIQKENDGKALNALVDIEDISSGSSGIRPGVPIVHSLKRTNEHDSCYPAINGDGIVASKVILSAQTFPEWLSRKKQIWNFKERRKRFHPRSSVIRTIHDGDNETSAIASKKPRKATASMEGYVRDAALALASRELHIVEIRELSMSETGSSTATSSGKFIVWVLVGKGILQKIQLTVPRTLYLNCRTEVSEFSTEAFTVKRVEKHLPHNIASKHMYEVTLPEHMFRKDDWLQNIFTPIDVAAIESFYELGTPLVFRSLLDLGCVARVNPLSGAGKSSKFA